MTNIQRLHEMAECLGLDNLVEELEAISYRTARGNAQLILPLVGEFSSGKTTLINALTDGKRLETATKPTTATIYEVHFGCESCYAQVLASDGSIQMYDEAADLRNEELADAQVVTVFDTSTRVPQSTILVDTPGLSSADPRHKQTLADFLPKADGILLVTDVNQQVTRSLTDFVQTMKLSRKPIYLVLTKCDTKSPAEIEAAKRYVSENCSIPLQQVAAVSASTDSLDELYALLASVQDNKNEILAQVDGERIQGVVSILKTHIDAMMAAAASSDEELDEAIDRNRSELQQINREIEGLLNDMADELEEREQSIATTFQETLFPRLNSLVTGKSDNFDAEAVSIINSTATLLMNDYKSDILQLWQERISRRRVGEDGLSAEALEHIDLPAIQSIGLSYDLDLNAMGHEYDQRIRNGVIAAAAVGAVAAIACSGGTAAGAVTTAVSVEKAIDVADTVSDVGSIIVHRKAMRRMEKAMRFVDTAKQQYQLIGETNQQMGQCIGSKKGLVESVVGLVTDNMMSKPQRVRAVRSYVEESLVPEFRQNLRSASRTVLGSIRDSLQEDVADLVGQRTASLSELRQQKREKAELFQERMQQLRQFKTELLTCS